MNSEMTSQILIGDYLPEITRI